MAPTSATTAIKSALTKALPVLRHEPGKLPHGSLLVRRPKAKGPFLDAETIENARTVELGQHIYAFSHLETNQVVYSLRRTMSGKFASTQLPYLGKQTRPAALRKDKWLPFCMAYFPSPFAGMEAYTKLKEYKRLHECSWTEADIAARSKYKDFHLTSRRERASILLNQKANAVADLAAVLLNIEKGPSPTRQKKARKRIQRAEHALKMGKLDAEGKRPVDIGKELGTVEGIVVRWADLRDAEFAENWPAPVVHSQLSTHRFTIAYPEAVPPAFAEAEHQANAVEDRK